MYRVLDHYIHVSNSAKQEVGPITMIYWGKNPVILCGLFQNGTLLGADFKASHFTGKQLPSGKA